MKCFITLFIIFSVAMRPVLPLINYVMNYDYIVQNLCENKDIADSTCKGKCYVAKELSKTEKQNTRQAIKISVIDVFVANDVFSVSPKTDLKHVAVSFNSGQFSFYSSDYFSKIFHPPLV